MGCAECGCIIEKGVRVVVCSDDCCCRNLPVSEEASCVSHRLEMGIWRDDVRAELEEARTTFHRLLASASELELGQQSNGTRWTNRQLLFHMLFGYMIVRSLLILVKVLGRLPLSFSRVFVRLLDAATRPFNVANHWGSVVGSRVFRDERMGPKFDAVVASLRRHLDRETQDNMKREMAYPTKWDPFFKPTMSLIDIYHYPKQHFDFHQRQLTVDIAPASDK